MAGLAIIRQALAALIQGATGANVAPYDVPQVNPPQIVIGVQPTTEVWATLEGAVDFQLRVVLIASAADDPSGQAQLDTWLDSSAQGSVVAAINQAGRLPVNGVPSCDYCVITRIGAPGGAASSHGGYGIVEWGGVNYIGTNILVEVAASLP